MSKLGPKKGVGAKAAKSGKKLAIERLTVEDLGVDVKAGRMDDKTCKTARTEDICSFGSGECDGKCPA